MSKERMDGYIRVSARKGRSGPSYISPKVQRDAIERWAEFKGVEIVEWFVDEDWSGGTHKRPGLEQAVERAVGGVTGGIVSAKIDRFSRFTEGGLRDLRRLSARGARLAFVQEDIDTSGPMGKFVYVVMLAMAEFFLDNIKAGWVSAKTNAVKRGAYISRTPFGYQREDDGTITPHPTEAGQVVEAYRLAATDSVRAAAEYLAREAPRITWNTATTRRTLARRVYLGYTEIGAFSGKTHDALVTASAWQAAQHSRVTRVAPAEFPLSGLPSCGNCGAPLNGGHGGVDAKLRVYRCSSAAAHGVKGVKRCKRGVVISAKRLEDYVRAAALEQIAGLQATIGDESDDQMLEQLERAHDEAAQELEAFAADQTLRRALGERYDCHRDDRIAAVERTSTALRDHAQRVETKRTLTAEDLLNPDSPRLFATGVSNLFASIVVSSGRGLHVAQRVRLVPFEGDGAAGEAAAQGS